MEYLTVQVPVLVWRTIDGCADNSAAVDMIEGPISSVTTSSCVRDAGWRAFSAFKGELDEYGWPPHDRFLEVTLRRDHWDWVLAQLERWEDVEDDEDDDDLAEARRLIADAIGAA